MKPTSIIFLIFSIVLVCAGMGLCFIAQNMAEKENIPLYNASSDDNGNAVKVQNFEDEDISRLALKFSDVDVNIIGSAETAKAELYNFNQNTYDTSIASKTLTIDNSTGFLSVMKFTENGFHFEGLRYYLNFKQYENKKKTVNVYIPSSEAIKKIDITINSGNLNISDMYTTTDYSIKIKNGDINMVNIDSSSITEIENGKGNIKFTNCILGTCGVKLGRGDLYFISSSYDWYDYTLTAALGDIMFGGNDKNGHFDYDGYAPATIVKAEVASGNIYIDSSMPEVKK